MSKIIILFAILLSIVTNIGCSNTPNKSTVQEKTATLIISQVDLPRSENIAFLSNGRMFVISATTLKPSKSAIYEVIKNGGKYSVNKIISATNGCVFSGLTAYKNTLYAACSKLMGKSKLFQIEFENNLENTASIQEVNLSGVSSPNGMAIDSEGSIFITDSFSKFYKTAAISKITIVKNKPLQIEVEKWLDKQTNTKYPNGVLVDKNTIYYVDHSILYSVEIDSNGNAGTQSIIYQTQEGGMIDDLTINNEYFIIAEIIDPKIKSFPQLAKKKPGYGSVKFISKKTKLIDKEIVTDNGINYEPSSIQGNNDYLFITDYFNGGLYKISN